MIKSTVCLVEKRAARRISTGEILGTQCDLSSIGGLKNLRVFHETLPPGHRSSPPHRHTLKDEFVYVLAGAPSLWTDGTIQQLKSGDFVALPAGTNVHHMVVNEDTENAEILLIASVSSDDETIYLPELDRVASA